LRRRKCYKLTAAPDIGDRAVTGSGDTPGSSDNIGIILGADGRVALRAVDRDNDNSMEESA
jgi:hypothetical protein